MKMSDAEIIKALECCSRNRCTTDGCPLAGNRICMTLLTTYALDLINRLKSENDDLKRDAIPKLQSSLDRANKYGIETDKENERLKAEIERLKSKVNRLKQYDEERDIRLHARLIATAKSEAYKEFAERLKTLLPYDGMSPEGRFKFGRIKSLDIDNILKEMGCE